MDSLDTSLDQELEALGDARQGESERVGTLMAEAPEPPVPQGGLLGKLHEQGFFKSAIALNQVDKQRADDRSFARSKLDDAQKDVDTWEQELRYKNDLLNNPSPDVRSPEFYKSDIEYASKKLEAARGRFVAAKAERDAQTSPYGSAFARGFLGTMESVARGAEGEFGLEPAVSTELKREIGDIPGKPMSGFWPNLAQGASEFGGSTLAFFAGGPQAALPLFALSGEGQFRDAAEAEKIAADPITMDKAARLYGWTIGGLQAVVPVAVLRMLPAPAREAVAGSVARVALRMASGVVKTTAAFELATELSNIAEKYGLSDLSGKPIDWNEIIQSLPERAKQSAIGGLFFGLAHEGGKLVKGGYRLPEKVVPSEQVAKPAEPLPPEEAAKDQELEQLAQPTREEQLQDELSKLVTERTPEAEQRKAEIEQELVQAQAEPAAAEGAVSPPAAVEARRAAEIPPRAETLAGDRDFLDRLIGKLPDAEREALEKAVDQNLPAFHADLQDFYSEAEHNFDLTDAQVRDVARLMAQGRSAEEALNDYADKSYQRESQRQEGETAAEPPQRPEAVGEGAAQPGKAVARVGEEGVRPAAPAEPQRAGEPVRGAGAEETLTPTHRARFRDLLKSSTPRKDWAKTLVVSPAQLESLVKEGEAEGLLRVSPSGVVRRTALARAEPAGPQAIVPSRLEVPALEVPPDLLFNRAVAERQAKTGEVIDPFVIEYAKRLSETQGTPDYTDLVGFLEDETWANKANLLDLAAVMGMKVTTKTTKAQALEMLKGGIREKQVERIFAAIREGEIIPQVQERELDERGLYSPSLEAVKKLTQERGTVQQMKAQLLSAGAKPKELEAMGFDKAFPDPNAKVSRGEIEQFLRENRVGLGQKILGASFRNYEMTARADGQVDIVGIDEAGGGHVVGAAPDIATGRDEVIRRTTEGLERGTESRFDTYSTPGGILGSYREVVTTLPPQSSPVGAAIARREQVLDEIAALDQRKVNIDDPETPRIMEDYNKRRDALVAERAELNKQIDAAKYTSSHWPGITNPLLHYRVKDFVSREPSAHSGVEKVTPPQAQGQDDRTVSGANKVRVLDELQSDWAQRARDQGTRDPAQVEGLREQLKDAEAHLQTTVNEIRETYLNKGLKNPPEAQRRLDAARDRTMDLSNKLRGAESGVPSAPFIGSTSDWVDLGLKQALVDAARDPSVSRFAWAPGGVQAERYSLEHHISSINVHDSEYPELRTVRLNAKGGQRLVSLDVDAGGKIAYAGAHFRDATGKNLSEVIGAEAAKQVMTAENGSMIPAKDLKVGGEGMRSFYGDFDKSSNYTPGIVGTRLLKLVKALDPEAAKIEPRVIRNPKATKEGDRWTVTDHDQVIAPVFGSKSQAEDWIAKQGLKQESYPSIPITPKLREALLKGQPMFALGGKDIGEEAARKAALQSLQSGAPVTIPEHVPQAVHEALKPVAHIVPKGTMVGSLQSAKSVGRDIVSATFVAADGATFSIPLNLKTFRALRSAASTDGRFLGFARYGAVGGFEHTLRGEMHHEVFHIIMRRGGLSPADRARFLDHAEKLQILDTAIGTYTRMAGYPRSYAVDDRTLRMGYEDLYQGDPDLEVRIKEEAGAHLLEAAYHTLTRPAADANLLLAEKDIEPVRDILDKLLSGEISKGKEANEDFFAALMPKENTREALKKLLDDSQDFSPEEYKAAAKWLDQERQKRVKAGERAAKGCLSKPAGFSIRD